MESFNSPYFSFASTTLLPRAVVIQEKHEPSFFPINSQSSLLWEDLDFTNKLHYQECQLQCWDKNFGAITSAENMPPLSKHLPPSLVEPN